MHIDNVSGTELDVMVAQQIMDMHVEHRHGLHSAAPVVISELPPFSSDCVLARSAELRFAQRHPGAIVSCMSRSPYHIVANMLSGKDYSATDASEATAMCRAMLKAMAAEGPGVPLTGRPPDRSAMARAVAAEGFATRLGTNNPLGVLMQALALQLSESKEIAARALLEHASACAPIVQSVAGVVFRVDGAVASCCVGILKAIMEAGNMARIALEDMQLRHLDESVAKEARSALGK